MGGAHLQCVNNHYATFTYKGMNTVELLISQIRHPKHLSKFNTHQK